MSDAGVNRSERAGFQFQGGSDAGSLNVCPPDSRQPTSDRLGPRFPRSWGGKGDGGRVSHSRCSRLNFARGADPTKYVLPTSISAYRVVGRCRGRLHPPADTRLGPRPHSRNHPVVDRPGRSGLGWSLRSKPCCPSTSR